MTISTIDWRISYSGNDATTVFAFPYRFLSNAHLFVIEVSAAGVETTKIITTDYTVTGANDDAGGEVTMLVAPATGTTLVIYRDTEVVQETDYISGDSFPAESHETALDKLTMILQEKTPGGGPGAYRSVVIPIGDPDTVGTVLPPSAGRLDKFLIFDTVDGSVDASSFTVTQITALLESGDGLGTVTSVDATVPDFLSITGSPITTTGTLAITYSGTALPVLNGGTGVTAIGGTPDGTKVLRDDWTWVPVSSSPGGSDTQVQFNDGGAFGGGANFTWDKVNNVLTMGAGAATAYIGSPDATAANTQGGGVGFFTGYGDGSGNGGDFGVECGYADLTGRGGNISLKSGRGGSTSGDGGNTDIYGGNANGSGDGNGGRVFLNGGAGTGAGRYGGHIQLQPGAGTTGPGNIMCDASGGGPLATTAVGGFFCIQTCAGTPTGTPANVVAGAVAMVYDTTNNKFYIYNGAWKSVTLA